MSLIMAISLLPILSVIGLTAETSYGEPQKLFENPKPRTKRQETSEICDFGSENEQSLCDWSNRNGSSLQWQFGAGSLSNWLGGPATDASQDTKGGYVFFETSLLNHDSGSISGSGSAKSPNAFIESSLLPTTSPDGKCISFNYDISGLSAAGIRVLLHPVSHNDYEHTYDRVLWTSKDTTSGWQRAEILYTFSKQHVLVFEGVARDTADPFRKYRGHVAVDNVARKPGSECRGHCTFEGGLCSWTNEEGDDFQWSLGRGSSSPSTGPSTDRASFLHGGIEGGYAYIDSSYPRRPGDVALLASDQFDPTAPDTPLCLRFWLHMYGNGIGSLAVLINDKEDNTDTQVWKMSGEMGNSWYQAEVPISSTTPFRILVAATTGKNNLGDIAIDDLSLIPGACPLSPEIASSQQGDCRFEVDECGWSNSGPRDRADDVDWDRVSGSATRPILLDHTFATDKGYFMALARSNNQKLAARAWLSSKPIREQSQPRCMSFWYIMYEPYIESSGPSLGAMTIYVRSLERLGSGPQMKPIWSLYNHQGPQWRYAQLPILHSNYSLIIEGTWGSSRTNGFIAIDDIAFFNGACTPIPESAAVQPGECHFDRDSCGWSNDTASASSSSSSSSSWRLAVTSRRPANLLDNTFGSPEGYVYFDLFNHNAANHVVRLVSEVIPAASEPLCMTFWFAAFGAGEDGVLKILREDNATAGSASQVVWELSAKELDTARPNWQSGQVTLDASNDFRIILEGMATNGGFAADDITFHSGTCHLRPSRATPLTSPGDSFLITY